MLHLLSNNSGARSKSRASRRPFRSARTDGHDVFCLRFDEIALIAAGILCGVRAVGRRRRCADDRGIDVLRAPYRGRNDSDMLRFATWSPNNRLRSVASSLA